MDQFRKNECLYGQGETCFEHAKIVERKYERAGRQFHSLWKRRDSWRKEDLGKLFSLAYINGKAAVIRKPAFVRQSPSKVVRSLQYLLQGPGDPYIRFEKVLAKGSRYKLNGLAVVGIICLMHLWKPNEFALIARPVDKAIAALIDFGRPMSVRKGQGFKDRTEAVKKMAKVTRLQTLGRVDHFLDAIAKNHIGNLVRGRLAV